MEKKIALLRKILKESDYTVALCGSGMLEEAGFIPVRNPERAYEIETKYGAGPEEIFTSVYYNTRTEKFFNFYKNEMLADLKPGESGRVLSLMEQAGDLDCIVTGNIYELSQRAGCKKVINLHGSIYENACPRCGRKYSVDYIKNSRRVPVCEKCSVAIRPGVNLFGEMIDSRLMEQTTREIEKAQVLLLLGTAINSDAFYNYIKYFNGKYLVIIHKEEHLMDDRADLLIYEEPKNVLPKLGYE
ncbi:MAG: Sir2 family NAD-dependent protein deacetylase [Eubacteriales bacterium]|nr:Sir2 family NAD-dependent protein deacetylase [Eubacteriales bacterium]